MKRSTMIELMLKTWEDYVQECTMNVPNYKVDIKTALRRILRAQMKAGMLPPPESLENVSPFVLYYRPIEEYTDESGMYLTTPEETEQLWEKE